MEQLTKKEVNRINSSLRQSTLSLFDTGCRITSEGISESIVDSMGKCTASIKNILDIFLCASTTDLYFRNLFNTMDSNGIAYISKICGELEEDPNVLNKISIRTVFGGTEDMPFRGLMYLIPSIRMCEELKKANRGGDIPNIEFYFMNGAAIVANSIDSHKAESTVSEFIKLAQAYIREYHPTVLDKVSFYVDKDFSRRIFATDEYKKVQSVLEEKLRKESELKEDLIEMGKRRSSSENTIKYAALHTFVQDGDIDSSVASMTNFFGKRNERRKELIISIGAKPEEKFFKARKLVAEAVSEIDYFTPKRTAQYIANVNVPPYSPLRTGELYLRDVLINPDLILDARKVSREDGEFGAYQMPVQKAVELIIGDTESSTSNKSICEFIEEYIRLTDDGAR